MFFISQNLSAVSRQTLCIHVYIEIKSEGYQTNELNSNSFPFVLFTNLKKSQQWEKKTSLRGFPSLLWCGPTFSLGSVKVV